MPLKYSPVRPVPLATLVEVGVSVFLGSPLTDGLTGFDREPVGPGRASSGGEGQTRCTRTCRLAGHGHAASSSPSAETYVQSAGNPMPLGYLAICDPVAASSKMKLPSPSKYPK